LGKPVNHVPTALQCDTCHTYKVAFKPAQMSHASGVAGKCSSCHNGNFTFANALAKPVSHIPVSSECDTCHTRGYISWSPANMNHTGLTACSTCHSGAYLAQNAQIKPATHLVTALQCNSCHNSTVTWASNPKPNHTGYVNNCSTNCHDGNPTHAIGKPVNHVPTTAQCDTCHNTTSFLLTPPMNHAGTAGQCASCHNGSYTTLGAQAKTAKHIPTTQSCDVCHTTSAWRPTSFAHTGVATGTCLTCHNGTNAAGKSVPHVPTTQSCDGCHRINAWMPLVTPYSHTGVAAGTCSTCHINSYPSIDVKPASHIPTTAACDACHTKTAWLPLTKYAHTGVGTGTCQNCHVSPYTSITLMPSNHIPVTLGGMLGRECSLCHTSTTSFMTEKMNHGSVTVCKNCHDRTATYLGTMDKKSVTHDKAGKTDCNNAGCHKPAAGGRGTLFVKW
jgi:hypothetical protein